MGPTAVFLTAVKTESKKKAQIGVILDPSVKDQLQKIADSEERSLTKIAERIIVRFLNERSKRRAA